MTKKIAPILACTAIFAFFLGGAFLIYSSYIKTQELQAKAKLEQEKTKQKMLKSQNEQQQVAQVTSSRKIAASTVVKKRTNYEAMLMNRMRSVQDTDFDGTNGEMRAQASRAYEAWDKELNKVYKLLMSELSESQKVKLRNEERAWLKKMVDTVERELDDSCGLDENGKRMVCGTLAILIEIGTKLDMVKARTIELARMYDDLHR